MRKRRGGRGVFYCFIVEYENEKRELRELRENVLRKSQIMERESFFLAGLQGKRGGGAVFKEVEGKERGVSLSLPTSPVSLVPLKKEQRKKERKKSNSCRLILF